MEFKGQAIQRLLILWFMMNSTPSQSTNTTSDQIALLSFKASISQNLLEPLSSWNQTLHFCRWPGITCSRRHSGRVTTLSLDSLNLGGSISPFIANLTFLRRLYLPGNQLQGRIPGEVGRLFRLHYLNLSANSLTGEIPSSLTHCLKLQSLSLRDNMLRGKIPANFSHLSDLQTISLQNNMLVGGIPAELSSLPNLSILNLRRNNLTGRIPPSLGNLSSLRVLDLSENSLDGGIPTELGRLTNLGAFDVIQNNLSGFFPSSIYNLSSIYYLGIGGNRLYGTIPSDIGHTLPNLQRLVVHGNQFNGPIPASLSNATGLQVVDFSQNDFSGSLPSNLGYLQNLEWLIADYNRIEARDAHNWQFLTSLTNCTVLEYLSLYGNELHGSLPSSIANLSTTLSLLAMGQNKLSGNIPSGLGNLVGLTMLALDENQFSSVIPPSLGRLRSLNTLRLFQNQLSGPIPSSLGNITRLGKLYLGHNSLIGSIPINFRNFQSLELLNLTHNKLTSSIPKELASLASLSLHLDLSQNLLTGSVPLEVGRLKNLQIFDVAENRLSGDIPNTIGGCQVLEEIHMEGNFFQGNIPSSLKDVKGIQIIDLSRNNISGNIPEFLQEFSFLQFLNLSFNNLQGPVPTQGVFQNVSEISVVGNSKLCGGDPELHLPACSILVNKRRHNSLALKVIIPVASVSVCLVLSACAFAVCYSKDKPIRKSEAVVSLKDKFMKISYAELLKATDGFSSSNLIGAGSFGSVYKGLVDQEPRTIAVKVLNLQHRGASKSFLAECEALKNIRHRNLIKILSACTSIDFQGNDFKALVFEYMPNGSLEKWLHAEDHELNQSRTLSLIQRLNIAIDVASALEYLHHHGDTPIVHCDLKPSNVLIDNDMSAHVGDFGLARFLPKFSNESSRNPSSSIGIKGTIGYIAPEYGVSGQISTSGDVYSYGVLLMEMFTGKRPVDESFKDGLSLHQYVEMAFPQRLMEIMDVQLILKEEAEQVDCDIQSRREKQKRMHDCLISVIKISLMCSKESHRERLDMGDVTREMNKVRERFLGVGVHGATE